MIFCDIKLRCMIHISFMVHAPNAQYHLNRYISDRQEQKLFILTISRKPIIKMFSFSTLISLIKAQGTTLLLLEKLFM